VRSRSNWPEKANAQAHRSWPKKSTPRCWDADRDYDSRCDLKANGKGLLIGTRHRQTTRSNTRRSRGCQGMGTRGKTQDRTVVKPILNMWEFSAERSLPCRLLRRRGTHYGLTPDMSAPPRTIILLPSAAGFGMPSVNVRSSMGFHGNWRPRGPILPFTRGGRGGHRRQEGVEVGLVTEVVHATNWSRRDDAIAPPHPQAPLTTL